jgi:hypothetical protein
MTLCAQFCTSSKYAELPKLTMSRDALSKSGGTMGGRGGGRFAAACAHTLPLPRACAVLPVDESFSDSWPGRERADASRCASLQRMMTTIQLSVIFL